MAGPMMTPGASPSVLDGPPPNPTPSEPQGQFQMAGLAGVRPPTVPTGQLPPELLTGIVASAGSVAQMLDSFAQATPDQAGLIAMIKDLLQQYLATLMQGGAGAMSPTATGAAPPMGGMDRGISGAGTF